MWAILIGYARSSTAKQDASLLDALESSGCVRVFSHTASGALDVRPAFARALDHLRVGDTIVVSRLLGRVSRWRRFPVSTGVAFQSHVPVVSTPDDCRVTSWSLTLQTSSYRGYITSVIEH